MPWFRLDDSFHSHPKVLAAGNEAVGLFVRCGTYAAEHLTDGFIREDIAVLYGASDTGSRRNPGTGKPETLAETLVRTKLWRRTRGGWRMPDYLEYNPSAKAVDKDRKDAAQRQRRRREALTSHRDSRSDNGVSHTTPTRPVTNTGPYGPAPPLRARDPTQDPLIVNGNSPASRLPSARPLDQALRDAGVPAGNRPASEETITTAAAQARRALSQRAKLSTGKNGEMELATNRDNAIEALDGANDNAGDAKREDYAATSALIGIGYSMLDMADAIREGIGSRASMADVESLLLRVSSAAAVLPAAGEPE